MIAFNKDENESPEDDLNDKLAELINKIYEENILDDIISEDMFGDFYYKSINLVEINNIIYKSLFQENAESIDLTILKNPNNSMDLIINKIKHGE